MSTEEKVVVIGGGLAGSEAAWQLASEGFKVDLYEMRPRGSRRRTIQTGLPSWFVQTQWVHSTERMHQLS